MGEGKSIVCFHGVPALFRNEQGERPVSYSSFSYCYRKSTIINLLLRFYDAKEGKLLLDGREYESLNVTQLRKQFGVVTQETELFPLSVEENIAYGLSKDEYTMDDVVTAAKQACAHEFIVEMKDGYETRIGERGNRLSGGQRQRNQQGGRQRGGDSRRRYGGARAA